MSIPPAAWQLLSLANHSVEIFDPPDAVPNRALLILPGWGERASHEASLTHYLAEKRLRAIAPFAATWWLDRIEPAFDARQTPLAFLQEHVMPWIEEAWDTTPPNIRLLGWEQGGQGILQLAFRRPKDFPTLAAIDAAIDFHEIHGRDPIITELFPNREAARQETALLRLHPAGWPRRMLLIAERASPWFDGVDRLEMKLRSMGIPAETVFYPGEDTPAISNRPAAIKHAIKHLAQESMGLPVVGR